MALFETIPELRRRKVIIDLAAWFPWKTLQGVPCADSCAIFFVNKPGKYCLNYGLADMHDDDENGILFHDSAVAAANQRFQYMEEEGGPGQSLFKYQPKDRNLVIAAMKETLRPSIDSSSQGQLARERKLLQVKEKRMDIK